MAIVFLNRRTHLIVSGRVQGVWFRGASKKQADKLGLTGWVRNLVSGDVELIAEGPEDAVQQLVSWCRKGPPLARVTSVESTLSNYGGEFNSFDIMRF